MYSFDEFCARLFSDAEIPLTAHVSAKTDLADELGLDSLQAFELVYLAQEWAGQRDDAGPMEGEGPFVPIITLGDVYEYYTGLSAREGGSSGSS